MSSSGTFAYHIDVVLAKVKTLTSWALRNFHTRSTEFILKIWKSIVLPRIDYGSQLWTPYKKADIQSLEMAQKSFLKKSVQLYQFSYWDILKLVGLYSIQRRHERYRIIYLWCILEGLVPNPKPHQIIEKVHPRLGRTCAVPIVKAGPYQQIVFSSFCVQGALLFNSIPKELRNMRNCEKAVFKAALDKHLRTVPDEPQIPGYTASHQEDSNSLLDMIRSS